MGMNVPHYHDKRALQHCALRASHQGQDLIRGARLIFPFELQQLSVHKA